DAGPGFAPERLASPSLDRAGGWGLALVAALARRWGVEAGVLTSVWFEIDRPQRESPVPVHDTIVTPSPGSEGYTPPDDDANGCVRRLAARRSDAGAPRSRLTSSSPR